VAPSFSPFFNFLSLCFGINSFLKQTPMQQRLPKYQRTIESAGALAARQITPQARELIQIIHDYRLIP